MTSNILYNVDIGFDTVPALPLDEIPKKRPMIGRKTQSRLHLTRLVNFSNVEGILAR